MKQKQGFTLLELIVVIIIIGILSTLGFVQYTAIIEKGRRAEAASILGTIRSMAVVWNNEGGHATNYPDDNYLSNDLQLPTPATGCATTHYFNYHVDSATGTATATRCTAGGKTPNGTIADTMILYINGDKGGTVTW